MLYRKVKNKFSSIPITSKVTLWYTFFIYILLFLIMSTSLFITNKLVKDSSEKELIKSVNEIVSGKEDFESFDDGIFFSIYKDNKKIEGAVPKGFDTDLSSTNSDLKNYQHNKEKYLYYDVKLNNKDEFIRGIIPISKFENGMKELSLVIIVIMPLIVCLVIIGGYRIIKNAFKPVGVISKTALEIGKNGDFSKRIVINEGKDEIHKMADAFNIMLDNLEKSYKREKQFNSDVSHELKTPVSVILAESEYALQYAEDVDEAKESLEVIYRQSSKMSSLISEILELSKLERKEKIDKNKINLSEIIKTVIEDYRILFNEKNIKVYLNVLDNITINGDRLMIERVVDNLLSNAIKFTKDKIIINLYGSNDDVYFEIEDNGIGIDENNLKLIWDRFYQVNDDRNKDNNKGYGLGLSFVYKIIKLHCGEIFVDSKLNEGTKFTIVLR